MPPAPADAPEVVAAPPDAPQVAAVPVDAKVETHVPVDAAVAATAPVDAGTRHHKEDAGTGTVETPKPPKEDKRSIEELFSAGELSKVNKACATSTHFNGTILLDCGLAACTAKDTALAKRWSNALSGQARADVVAKCHDMGIDL